jgi:hypothetical protein
MLHLVQIGNRYDLLNSRNQDMFSNLLWAMYMLKIIREYGGKRLGPNNVVLEVEL